MSDFDQAISYVLQNEGGFVDNPSDPGGRTKFGITQKLLDLTITGKDVADITSSDAASFYKVNFWLKYHIDQLADQMMATCILDMAVNCGPHQAVTAAQLACGYTVTDGVLGSRTIASLNSVEDKEKWLHDFLVHMKDYYCGKCAMNSALWQFMRGWMDRLLRMVLLLETVQLPKL
jgi:lysozyme family protein